MTEIVAIGARGTHARFAFAEVDGGRVVRLADAFTLRTAEHESLRSASRALRFARRMEEMPVSRYPLSAGSRQWPPPFLDIGPSERA
ncbi:MAG TPA: hypothetical protein VF548_04705 [Allosphingosinicella sp.]|jgi:hypothetical protein